MAEEDFEILGTEGYSSEKNFQFSHNELVMRVMRKCIEAAAREMKQGYFNTKIDKAGNQIMTYIDDTRKAFIESVQTVEMVMACDMDREAHMNIAKLKKKLKDKHKELCNQETLDWNNSSNAIKNSRWSSGIYYKAGYLNKDLPFAQEYIEIQVEVHRKIFKQLTLLTKRLDFYREEMFEA